MAQDTTPAIVVYRGNGDNSVPYDVPFDKGYYGEVKVAFIRRGLDDYTYEPDPSNYTVNGRLYAWFSGTGYVYTHTPNPAVSADIYNNFDEPTGETVSAVAGQTITVNSTIYSRATQHDIANQLLLTWTGTVLTSDDFICIVRDTERGQPYTFPNNQKHIENALDNIERQIQENKSKLDNALLVDPAHTIDTSKMAPLDWMKSIVRCVDFSVRAVRFANGWLDYSLDDPNIADADKTWVHLLNTDNIKAIRERSEIVDNETVYWTEYQASDGTWRTLANTSEWESRIQYAVDTAEDAKDVADDAKDIAQDAKDIADTFDGRLTQAEQDASDAKDIAQDASDVVSAHITDTNNPHSVTAAQVGALPNTTKYGATLSLTVDSTTYVVTAQLKDQDGNNLGTAQTIDLPLESVVVSGSYDSATKEVVLTLKDGSTIRFSVADLVSGLQTEITALNMLSADLVDDTNTTHKFVTTTEKTTWNGKQDAISDLATIRSGASAGATAVQPGDLATVATSGSYNDLSNKPTIPAAQVNSDWNANSGVAQILNKPTLATVATSGSYNDLSNKPTIPTTLAGLTGDVDISSATAGQHLVYDGTKWKNQTSASTVSWGGITGSLSDQTDLKNALDTKLDAIDGATITKNSSDEIQAVGTVNQNTATGATNPIKSWLGDINEYNNQSVPTSNPDALCFIVDKTQTAIDRYIVEAQYPDDTNGYTWYFLYSDGWVEQGGYSTTGIYSSPSTTNLLVAMADANYTLTLGAKGEGNYTTSVAWRDKTTTGFTTEGGSNGTNAEARGFNWQVSGMAA